MVIVKGIVKATVFMGSIWMVCQGHHDIGFSGVAMQLVGILGIIGLLWNYNRKFNKE